jgi:hypothetical protein
MFDELVNRLHRYSENCVAYKLDADFASAVQEAADVIEELAAFKAKITDGHFYCMRDGILYEAKLNPPKAKSIKLPPIKFAEQPKEE